LALIHIFLFLGKTFILVSGSKGLVGLFFSEISEKGWKSFSRYITS